MIEFNTITIEDKNTIDKCLENNNYQSCDFCFANLFAWRQRYRTEFAIAHETLFIKFIEHNGKTYYMMPIGKMSLTKAFDLLISHSLDTNIPFRMKGISHVMWQEIEKAMPGKFRYTHERDNDEYIYQTQKLIHLQGKKLQRKRNHINRFKQENPDWVYIPLTLQEEVEECLQMLDIWENLNTEKANKTLRFDYIATQTMLKHYFELQLQGGAIRSKGKIVAFSLGEAVSEDTFVVHAEKAYSTITGAYAIINQQFAEHCAAPYTYINREEDMGIENLRKSKKSYYPDYLLREGHLSFL